MNKKVTSIVAYCTILGWRGAYFAGDRENSKFHLNQGLVLGIFSTGIEVILSVFSAVLGAIASVGGFVGGVFAVFAFLVGLLGSLVGVLVAVLIVIGILNAVNDKETELPVIGKIRILK